MNQPGQIVPVLHGYRTGEAVLPVPGSHLGRGRPDSQDNPARQRINRVQQQEDDHRDADEHANRHRRPAQEVTSHGPHPFRRSIGGEGDLSQNQTRGGRYWPRPDVPLACDNVSPKALERAHYLPSLAPYSAPRPPASEAQGTTPRPVMRSGKPESPRVRQDTRSLPATPGSGPATSSGQWPRRAEPTGRTPPGR